jgi:hypothetical protein
MAGLVSWGRPTIFEAGPVSQAHTMFNHDCQLCHADTFQTPKRLWPTRAGFHSVTDSACQRCHAGADHQAQVSATGCAGCHQEHRGRPFLAQVADSQCTTCHANLDRHPARQRPLENVRGFAAGDHPEFGLWRGQEPQDPSRIRFNHRVHLRAQGLPSPGGRRETLDCGKCHQLDSERRYMLPINYQTHCAQCHPLGVMVVDNLKDEKARVGAVRFGREPAPHAAPATVRSVMRERYRDFFRSHSVEAVREKRRPFPGKPPLPPEVEEEETWMNRQYQVAERMLFSGGGSCRNCHLEAGAAWQPGQLPVYAATRIPARWFAGSRFSHDAHRLLRCTECHEKAPDSGQAKDVLMPRIGVCQSCHNAQIGARTDCSECHTYHDRRREAQGGGALTIQDCLHGR